MILASWKKSSPSKGGSNEDAIKKEDCHQVFFFFYRWICVWSVGIDVLGLTETRISCHYRLSRERQDFAIQVAT